MPDVDCPFCEIVSGRSGASVVLRDARCTAFLDVQPINEGHVLVVPNEHARSLQDLPEKDGAAVFRVAQEITAALYKSELRCEGINLRLADGEVAGQDVFHVHLHVIPRFEGDGVGRVFGPGYEDRPDRKELNKTAKRVREALRQRAPDP